MDGGQYHNLNGDVPNIPVITLAGITSLTDLLPELPVPGPAPSGSQTLGSNLLYHASIAQEANQYLSMPNENLTTRIGEALANTPFENYQIHPLSATDQVTPLHHTSVLANYIIRNNPSVFQYQSQWNSMNSHYQNINSEQQYIDPQQHHLQQHPTQLQHQHTSVGLRQPQNAADVFSTHPQCQQLNNRGHSSQQETKPDVKVHAGHGEAGHAKKVENVLDFDGDKKVKVEEKPSLPRESKQVVDDKDSKSSRLSRSSSKRNDDQGGPTTSNPVNTGSRPKRSNNQQTKYQDAEVENSDDDTDEEEDAKKGSRKFFKATEKEREDERRKLKDERRKRKLEDADFKCSEDEKRRRKDSPQRSPSPEVFVPKVITKKIERKLVPVIPKLDVDELMNSNIFLKFNKTVELIFDNLEEVNMDEFLNGEEGGDLPSEILIPKYQLQDLANETAKLKSMGVTDSIPAEKITKLLGILELNIRDGSKVSPIAGDEDEDEDADKLWLELTMERVMRAADSSLTVLNILTSKGMGKVVYLEDVIDRVALFIRFQLSNTIYPSYDPVYKEMSRSKTGYVGSMKKKRSYAHQVRDKNILGLYNKVTELVSLFAELVRIQLLTDTTVLHISTLGVAPFFVENVAELQLAALRLVTNVFSKYENHRRLLLDDILASIARLPSSKRSLRTYRLNANSHIQMLTALVLQLIQCVVVLPRHLAADEADAASKAKNASNIDPLDAEEYPADMDKDVLINSKYSMAMATAHQFLTVFLKKCGSKNEDIDYRPLFENFVQDLLTTVNIPEWPAAELILSLLGHVLREKFKEKSTEMALRNSSLEYLGVVAARLRKDVVQSKNKVDYIDSIIKLIKDEEEKESGETPTKSKKKKSKELKDPEEERTRFLQRVLLDYLAVNGGETDHATMNARHFYICQWYRDANASTKKAKKVKKTNQTNNNTKKNRKRRKDSSSESSEEEDPEEEETDEDEDDMSEAKKAELFRIREDRKKFLVAKILPFGSDRGQRAQVLSTHIDHESAHLIVKYLSSKRPFFNSFNSYLQDILNVLSENSTHVRTKALKCMAMIVAEDPEVLLRHDMQTGVQYSFMDSSTMVREAAVDLLGKYILHNQDLITQYYKIITDRILDTGVSVRKRVIKILKDICLGFPQYDKIPEICVKMIRRINDEEGIRKLVMEVFQNMWFIPIRDKKRTSEDDKLLLTRARNITDVVVACHDTGLEWFEQLLQTLFKPKEDKEDATIKNTEPPPQLVLACQQIVDCLVESVLRMEESSFDMTNGEQLGSKNTNSSLGSNPRIVACLTTLYLFAKIRAQFLVEHVQTLQPYLSVVCKTKGDYQIIADVARTLELVVPLLKHPSEIFMAQLEEDNVRLMLQHDRKVVMACVSCLGSIVNEVTKNYGLVRDCFTKLYSQMTQYRNYYERNPKDPRLDQVTPKFRRSMFTVGLLLKHFDFSNPDVYTGLEGGDVTVDEVFETTLFFILHHTPQIQLDTLNSLGFICIRHHDFMVQSKLKQIYIDILTEDFYSVLQKVKVLNNIEQFLIEEEIRMIKMDKHWRDYADKENLKEMGDVSSGMASTVVQSFISGILESLLNPDLVVRHAAIKVVSLIHNQGLIHPINFVPYLMCASTDVEQKLAHTADRELQEIEKKYPGFVYMKHLQGIKLSFKLQQTLQNGSNIVRGFRQKEGELPSAMSGFIYSILKTTKAQRRGILNGLLKQFDDTAKSSLTMMLYLADNLAYIPYTVLDEPLYVIHHIDIMISVSGSNLLQTFKECLKPPPSCEKIMDQETGKVEYVYDEDLDDDFESVYSRLPDDCKTLQEAITASQGCMLLLVLKEHLKDLYGLNASKITQYSPADNNKAYERQVNRRANVQFDPRATVEILRLGDPPDVLSDVHKRDLVKKYLQFKELMNKIDPDDEEEEVDETGAGSANPSPIKQNSSKANHITPSKQNKRNQESDEYNPSGSGRQSQHIAYIQVQNQDQNSRPRPSRAAAVAANAAVSATNNSDAMVLDPVTGEYMSGNSYYDNGGNYGNANDVHMVNSKQAFMNHGQLKHSKSSLQVSGRDISKHSDDGRGRTIKNSHHKRQHRTSSRR